jgi:hypothetical protein
MILDEVKCLGFGKITSIQRAGELQMIACKDREGA